MDHLVRTIVWVALFGGTGVVILVTLPRVVIWCLEIVDAFQKTRSRKKTLNAPHKSVSLPPQPEPGERTGRGAEGPSSRSASVYSR